ncbi:hypothetical protein AC578_9504 [Pseudocercospora eumusae]|uniref:Uncharacterized protein n=1 Tax=Pseudocercospora eumusae TaxID=321146 RepID=A0A139HGA9_9PEZI|nr:hypothetical protein AC578_9504 [Pseudocercospora eumusae]
MARGHSKKKKKASAAVLLRQLKPRQRSPSLDRKPLLDANASRIPDEPPECAYDPAPNRYAVAPTPVQELPTEFDMHGELRQGSNAVKCCRIEDPFNPNTPPRYYGHPHTIYPRRVGTVCRWMTVIIPLLLLSTTAIMIACLLYKGPPDPTCVRLSMADSENVQCGDDVSSGEQSIPKCHGLPMMRIGNASAEFEGQVWKAWTYAYAFGEETFACASLDGWWECREVGCEGEECESFSDVCAVESEEGKEDDFPLRRGV